MRNSKVDANRRLRVKPLVACLLPLAIGNLACATAAGAATLPVTNCNDSGSGSLRDTVASASSGDSVDLRALSCDHISLTSGGLAIAVDDLVLQGPGSTRLTIDSETSKPFHAVIQHDGVGALHIDSLRITDGGAGVVSSGTLGLNESIVTGCANIGISARGLIMRNSTVSDNGYTGVTVSGGNAVGATETAGDTTITGSTISGNRGGYCGGWYVRSTGTVRVENTTISGNSAAYAGCITAASVTIANSTVAFNLDQPGLGGAGALTITSPQITLESTIFANNTATDLVVSAGTVLGGHNNLMMLGATVWDTGLKVLLPADTLTADPLLLPLADNGGPTQTHALAPGSPAIDAGSNSAALTTDQRGAPFARVVGAAPDIGAFESGQAVNIDAGFTGSWFDPTQAGHGLMLEVLPGKQLLALWFAFDPTGKQAWFGGVGVYDGNTATISAAALPTGGRWIPNFDQNAIVSKTWGSLTFTFSDHDHGRVNFNSVLGFGVGGMDLLRLTNIATQSGTSTPIGSPGSVVAGAAGNVYFSSSPNRIFKVDPQGALTRVAGSGQPGYSGDGGAAVDARFNFPLSYPELVQNPNDYSELVGGLALDAQHNLYVADAYNNRVRRIDANGIVTTVLGNGFRANAGDGGPAAQATIYWPQGVAVDNSGNLLVSSAYGALRRIAANGIVSTLATANCGAGYLGQGLCVPEQIAVDSSGDVLVPDAYCRVREVGNDGITVTVAGNDDEPSGGFAFTCGYSGDGGPATAAAMSVPYGVAIDASNNLYIIADTGNHCIRKVSAGIISTVAGKCTQAGFAGDGGAATGALLDHPRGIAIGADGSLYIADTNNNRIRKVSSSGVISTIAGNGEALQNLEHGTIGPGFTGNWFDPAQSGHGLMLEVLPDNRLLAYWFAFDPAGNQAWFGGVGTYSGTTATIPNVTLPTGAKWIPNFDPHSIVPNAWGTLTFEFTSCNRGTVTFNSTYGFGTGSMNLTRLTQPAGLTCP